MASKSAMRVVRELYAARAPEEFLPGVFPCESLAPRPLFRGARQGAKARISLLGYSEFSSRSRRLVTHIQECDTLDPCAQVTAIQSWHFCPPALRQPSRSASDDSSNHANAGRRRPHQEPDCGTKLKRRRAARFPATSLRCSRRSRRGPRFQATTYRAAQRGRPRPCRRESHFPERSDLALPA